MTTTLALVLLAALTPPTLVAASDQEARAAAAATRVLFRFHDGRITESSGLESSKNFRRVLFTHNDRGDTARFFAVGLRGFTKAVYRLRGAANRDWEAISAGRGKTLWFGDIGANRRGRPFVSAYRVPEPGTLQDHPVRWTRYDFKYDDLRSHNAEAMLVHPRTGALYVVTKQKRGAGIYRASTPLSTTGFNTLNRVARAPVKVTGGDFSANGKRLVLRNYRKAYFYTRVRGRATVTDVPASGGSIAFARDGRGVLVGSEGVRSAVWRVASPRVPAR